MCCLIEIAYQEARAIVGAFTITFNNLIEKPFIRSWKSTTSLFLCSATMEMAIDDEEWRLAKTSEWSYQCNAHELNTSVAISGASPTSLRAIQMMDVAHTAQISDARCARTSDKSR